MAIVAIGVATGIVAIGVATGIATPIVAATSTIAGAAQRADLAATAGAAAARTP